MFIGKLLGGFFGLLLLQSLFGVIIGLFVGHLFDKGLAQNLGASFVTNVSEVKSTFFETTFMVMGYIAKADGRVSEQEIKVAEKTMAQLQLAGEQRRHAMNCFGQGKSENFNFQEQLLKFKQICRWQRQLVVLFLEIQVQSALADGAMVGSERDILYEICDGLGISRINIDNIEARYQAQQNFHRHYHVNPEKELVDAYGVLGLTSSVSDAQVKKAYRKLMSQHHPDKLIAKGLPDEMIKVATEKSQDIQNAYQVICKKRDL